MRTEKEQREIIRKMDELRYPHESNGISRRLRDIGFGAVLVLFFLTPGCIFFEKGRIVNAMLMLVWVVFLFPAFYLSPYRRVTEGDKKQDFYLANLKYLPIDPKQVKLVRMGYLADFLKKMLIIECAEQIFTSILASEGSNPLKNITLSLLYTVFLGGILPLLWGSVIVWTDRGR